MTIHRYVDPAGGDDSYDGTQMTWSSGTVGPKKTLQGAIDLFTGPINDETIIHLKHDTEHFVDGATIKGLRCVGQNASLIIQPETWNDTNYTSGAYDPFGADNTGTFDIKAAKNVKLALQLEIENSDGITIRGVHFYSTSGGGGLALQGCSSVTVAYCRFEGEGASARAIFNSLLLIENCYFMDNAFAVGAMYGSQVQLVGNNYLDDPIYVGIHVAVKSLAVVRGWYEHPVHFCTTEITTTTPRRKRFAAIKVVHDSTFCVQDESVHPAGLEFMPGTMKIAHAHPLLGAEHFGVLLESRSCISGAERIASSAQDAKGDATAMPSEQAIVAHDDEGTMVKY